MENRFVESSCLHDVFRYSHIELYRGNFFQQID
jgi:hypothetical protein